MRTRDLKVACGILLLCAFGGCSSPPNPLDAPDELVLYSIDGTPHHENDKPETSEQFHDVPVLGKIVIEDADERKEICQAIKDGMARPDGIRACFWPRHGLRVTRGGKVVDYVICFECCQLLVFEGDTGKGGGPIAKAQQEVLDKYLKRAGIPLAPKAIP